MTMTTTKTRCIEGGAIVGTYEAQTVARCSCGWVGTARPRKDRRVAGEIVPGWTYRMPAHYPGAAAK